MSGAIVTGSDSGIGRATAIALARAGFDIGITWHSDESGAEVTGALVRESGRAAHLHRLDLGSPADAASVIDDLADSLGCLDVLVNNAAVDHRAGLLDETLDAWTRVLTVNLTGAFTCAQAAARRMIARREGGRIVNVTSIHECHPTHGGGAYCAAKAGLGLLTKVMALELAEHEITVNAVAPGHIASPMTGFSDRHVGRPGRAGIPMRRIGSPDEIAQAIVYLCSPSAAYTTGASFAIDGGLSLMAVGTLVSSLQNPR